MEDGFHISVFACHLNAFVHIFLDLRIGFKISVYQFFGFLTGNIHTFCQPEDRDTVYNTKIGGFSLTAHIGGYFADIHLIYFGSGGRMDIISAEESVNHISVLTQMCHNTQFNL